MDSQTEFQNKQDQQEQSIEHQDNSEQKQEQQNAHAQGEGLEEILDQKPKHEKSSEKTLELKMVAQEHYTSGNINSAIDYYEQALEFCPEDDTKMLTILNSNLAICYLKNDDLDSVIHFTTQALKYDPQFKKALLNRAYACEKVDKVEEAFEDYKILEEIDPKDLQIRSKRALLQTQVEQTQEKRKAEVLNGLKDLGNTILGKFGMSLNNFKMEQNENGSYNIQYKQ